VLWVDPSVAPPGTPAEARVGGPAEEQDPALLALRAVEVLRARLVKVPLALPRQADGGTDDETAAAPDAGLAEHAAIDAGPPPAIVDAALAAPLPATADQAADSPAHEERPDRMRLALAAHSAGLSAAPAVILSPGGVSPSFGVRIGAGWDFIPRLGLEAMAIIPATAGTVTAMEGAVDLRALAVGGGLRAVLTDPAAPFSFALGLGVDAMMLSFSGRAQPPLTAETGSRWGVAPYLSATAAYRVHAMVSLRLDVLTAIVRPEPILRVAGSEIASFGLPAVVPSLGVEVRP
jgi:hypothetical protein